jgi:uncharacterized protein
LRLLALLFLLLAGPVLGQSFPALSGRVVDAANLLPADVEARIDGKLKALEDATGGKGAGRQLVVATVPSLDGLEIEDYGYRLGRAWGIGQKGADNGAILLVAPNERKVRIEVGYGLEPVLTDALSKVIIEERIVPKFRAGDFPGGIEDGTDTIAQVIQLPPEEQERLKAAAAAGGSGGGGDGGFPLGALIFFLLMALWLWMAFRSKGRGMRRAGRGGPPIIIWGPGMGGWGGGSGGGGWGGGGFGGGGFSGGGGGFGGGGASGGW